MSRSFPHHRTWALIGPTETVDDDKTENRSKPNLNEENRLARQRLAAHNHQSHLFEDRLARLPSRNAIVWARYFGANTLIT